MRFIQYKLTLLIAAILFSAGCNAAKISKADSLPIPTPQRTPPKKNLTDIDLTKIGAIAPKGRVQDKEYNRLPVIDELLANGKDSIPFLIEKLDDETKIDGQTIDYWYEVRVGDTALVILSNFFTKTDAESSTIKGFGWDEFLERGNDKDSMGEAILRKYVKKHGRKNIKERWQKMWDEHKDNIFWDDAERCFKLQ